MLTLPLKKYFFSVILISSMMIFSGCFYLVIGGVGALGGYAISPDTVEGVVAATSSQDVWQAAVDTVSIMGIIEEKNEFSSVLICKVAGTRVTVSVAEPVTDNVKLRVKARKGMMPKVKLAQDIYTKIVQKVHP